MLAIMLLHCVRLFEVVSFRLSAGIRAIILKSGRKYNLGTVPEIIFRGVRALRLL